MDYMNSLRGTLVEKAGRPSLLWRKRMKTAFDVLLKILIVAMFFVVGGSIAHIPALENKVVALEAANVALEAANVDLRAKYQHHEKVFQAIGPIVKEVEFVTKADLGERKWKRTIEKIAADIKAGKKGEWPL